MTHQKELEFAKSMAQKAGQIMKRYYRGDQHIEFKDGHSPVTVADKEINQLLIHEVNVLFPEHGVLGEEQSWNTDSKYLWVCDPIDGTRMYTHHIPTSMFSLAFVTDGNVELALCYNPWTNDEYTAVKGGGAWRNGQRIYVQKEGEVNIGVWRDMFQSDMGNKLLKQDFIPVMLYPMVIKGCLVAEGSLTGLVASTAVGTHDIAAISLLVSEAGGKVTDINGKSQKYNIDVNGTVMSNGIIHDTLVKTVQS